MNRLTFDGVLLDIAECLKKLKILEGLKEQEQTDNALLRRALDTFGAEAQTRMVFEEFSELQKELCKHSRGKDNRMEIAEEIADVQIMLEQMIILHDCAEDVKWFRIAKLNRLAERLDGGAE